MREQFIDKLRLSAKNKDKPTAVDLFAGAGGFSLGVSQAGFNVLAAVEFDKAAAQTYRRNHKDTLMIRKDILKLTSKELLKRIHLKKGMLDLLFGGPPCQGFTTINTKRSINDPRSKLMHEFIRITKEIQPKVFLIENVPGLLSFKDFFILLLETLEKSGYVVRFTKLDAVSYSVPQYRKRIFIQGIRKDQNKIPMFPAPTHFDPVALKLRKDEIVCIAEVAARCFSINGFSKEEVKDVWWNNTLQILMNKKTAATVLDKAINQCLGEICYQAYQDSDR